MTTEMPEATMTPGEIESVYGWLPPDALDAFIDAWPESGNADVAWSTVRQDPRYQQWFPGNMTEDGRPRYSEDVYAAVTASYDDVFRSVGISGVALEEMRARYGELVAGDVSPSELEANRVAPMHDRIINASDFIKAEYAEKYGIDMTTEGLLASAMNPELGEKVLTRQISLAEIGGEARESNVTLNQEMIELLADDGMDRAGADALFESIAEIRPILSTLAKRHADPDDEFDVNEFIAADIFKDPTQMRRMNRLAAQERALFTNQGGVARSRTGELTGLADQ